MFSASWAYCWKTVMFAFASASEALSIMAVKNDHLRYMFASTPAIAGSSAMSASQAEPMPNQAGMMQRFCVQEKTHGMARRSSMRPPALRFDGREPIGSFSIALIGVAAR